MKKHQSFLLLSVFFVLLAAIFGNRFLFPSGEVRAQLASQSPQESLDRRVEIFFNNLKQSNVSAATAFENLFRDASSAMASRISQEAVQEMSKKLMDLTSSEIGRIQDHEKINEKPVGKDVLLLKYLTKHDNAPVSWSFTFYRSPRAASSPSGTGWSLIFVRFDTDLESATD